MAIRGCGRDSPSGGWSAVAVRIALGGSLLFLLPNCGPMYAPCGAPGSAACVPDCPPGSACRQTSYDECACGPPLSCVETFTPTGQECPVIPGCPEFQKCVFAGVELACVCVPSCELGSSSQCGGDCPPGQQCQQAGAGCSCQPVGCGGEAPQCAGTCPAGDVCRDVGGICACAAAVPCFQTAPPSCGGGAGACGAGQSCVAVGDDCVCRTPCAGAAPGQCGLGFCPDGETCVGAGGACGCQVVQDTCGDTPPRECRNGSCAGGQFCVRLGDDCGCGAQPAPALVGLNRGGITGDALVAPVGGNTPGLALFAVEAGGALVLDELWQDELDAGVRLGGAIDADVLDVDPNARRVAVAAPGDDAVSLWSIDAAGPALAPLAAVVNDPTHADLDEFVRPIAVEWSPDGKHLYVLTTPPAASAGLWTFTHDAAGGTLAFAQKLLAGTDIPLFGFPSDLETSPDGKHLYVTGNSASTLTVFARDPSTGLLTLGVQLRDNTDGVNGLANPAVVTVAADGSEVYAGGAEGFVVFTRNQTDGTLTVHQVVLDDAASSLLGVDGITASADGTNLYVGSTFGGPTGGALTRFVRGDGGLFAPVRSVEDAVLQSFGPIVVRADGVVYTFTPNGVGVYQANLDLIERENGQVLDPPGGLPSPMTIAPALAVARALGYQVPANPAFALASNVAGESPGHEASFDVSLDLLETHTAEIAYPPEFGFNGFTAVGPPGTPIATFAFDVDRDGRPEYVVSVNSIDAATAYADTDWDRTQDATEPVIQHVGEARFRIVLPQGGDGRASTLGARLDARRTVRLVPGVLRNPTTAGTYALAGTFTSVDPDTGDASDGQGTPPTSFAIDGAGCAGCTLTVVECADATACDDGDACTDDACGGGRCTHARRTGARGAVCALRQPALCGTESVPAKVTNAIASALGRADALLALTAPSGDVRADLTRRQKAQARKLLRKAKAGLQRASRQVKLAAKQRKIGRECRKGIDALLKALRTELGRLLG